jgi:hypothetical protein
MLMSRSRCVTRVRPRKFRYSLKSALSSTMPAVTGSLAGRAAWAGDALLTRGAEGAGGAAAVGGASATEGKAASSLAVDP